MRESAALWYYPPMFNITSPDLLELQRTLTTLARRSMPKVAMRTLNDTAFDASAVAKANITGTMINRNTWTARSIRVDKAKRGDIAGMVSKMGTTADYMERQEFGATVSGNGGAKSIPTSYSAGQSPTATPRTRVPRKANRMGSIQLAHVNNGGRSRKQRNLIAVKSREKFVYLDLGRVRGIFRITGSKKKPKINMVQDLSRQSVTIPRHPVIGPAQTEALQRLPAYYADAMRDELRALGLL